MPTGIARSVLRILLALVSISVLLIAGATGWLFFYSSDLPNVRAMSSFAPDNPIIIDTYICGERASVVALPTSQLTNVRNALFAAEGDADRRTLTRRLYDSVFRDRIEPEHYGSNSVEVSRQLLCDGHLGSLNYVSSVLRTSVQLKRHFTTGQLLDIYLNRVYFGPGVYGVENAAQHYFAKSASQLSTPEAALLMGLLKSPVKFSPLAHPGSALARRNEVIDAMAKRGSISTEQAEQAKKMPLGTVSGAE